MSRTPESHLDDMTLKSLKTRVLNEQFSYLCDELGDPGRYIPFMRSKGVLIERDSEEIRNKTTSADKAEAFVQKLINNKEGKNQESSFDIFINALRKQKVQAHISRVLLKSFSKLKSSAEEEAGDRKPSTPGSIPLAHSNSSPTLTNRQHPGPTEAIRMASTESDTTPVAGDNHFPVHPVHGPLPPTLPPIPASPCGDAQGPPTSLFHPEHGPIPPMPPPSSSVVTPYPETGGGHHQDTLDRGPTTFGPSSSELVSPTQPSSYRENPFYETLDNSRVARMQHQPTKDILQERVRVLEEDVLNLRSELGKLMRVLSSKDLEIDHLKLLLSSCENEIDKLKAEKCAQNDINRDALHQLQKENDLLQMKVTEQLHHSSSSSTRGATSATTRPTDLPIDYRNGMRSNPTSFHSLSFDHSQSQSHCHSYSPHTHTTTQTQRPSLPAFHLSPMPSSRRGGGRGGGGGTSMPKRSVSQDNIIVDDRRSLSSSNGSIGSANLSSIISPAYSSRGVAHLATPAGGNQESLV